MLHVPRALVRHDLPLSLPQHLGDELGHARLGAELLDRREERFEVEDDGAAEGEAAQGLPVHAQVNAREGEIGDLAGAEVFVRVAGGHEERSVDFEAPGAALDGVVGEETGEVAVRVGISGGYASRGQGERPTDPWRIPFWPCSLG